MYCYDTETLSAVVRRKPSFALIRRLAVVQPSQQFTTAITLGELLYGAAKRGSTSLEGSVRGLISTLVAVLPFDAAAAELFADLRVRVERAGEPLAEPDLRIAAIALSRDLVMVTGNVRHFARVPGLTVENWLQG